MKHKLLSDGSKVILFFRGQYIWFFRWKDKNGVVQPLQSGMADELLYAIESTGLQRDELEGVPLVVSVPEELARYAL